MNQITQITKPSPEREFFLSEFLGAKVMIGNKKVGKLIDVVIKENGTLPVVTYFCVSLPFGEKALVPWEKISDASPKGITVTGADINVYRGEPEENAILLKDHVLDKEIIDMDGKGLEVAYDIKLTLRNKKLYVSEVDLSRYGLLRRLGLTGLANFIYNLAESIREQTISWTYVQPLPSNLGRFRGNLQLKVLKEKLADMYPVDIADILEEVDHEQRLRLFQELEPEQASDTLEEIDPNAQRDLLSSLDVEKSAQLINEMTPGQAADVLGVLPSADAKEILELMDEETVQKVQPILEEHEQKILNYATTDIIKFPPDKTVGQAQDEYRVVAKGKQEVMYLHIVDEQDHLLGVLDIKELLQSNENARLSDVMVDEDNVISLEPDSTLREAAETFAHYGFRAIPVVDEEKHILGVVTYRDVMNLKHSYIE